MAGPILVLALIAIPVLIAGTVTFLIHRAYWTRHSSRPKDLEQGQNHRPENRLRFAHESIEMRSLPSSAPPQLERTDFASPTQRSRQSGKQDLKGVKGLGGGFVGYSRKLTSSSDFTHEHNVQDESEKQNLDIVAPEPIQHVNPFLVPYLPDADVNAIWKKIEQRRSLSPKRKPSDNSYRSILKPLPSTDDHFTEIDLGDLSPSRLKQLPSVEDFSRHDARSSQTANKEISRFEDPNKESIELSGLGRISIELKKTKLTSTPLVKTPLKLAFDNDTVRPIKLPSDGFETIELHQTPPMTPRTSLDYTNNVDSNTKATKHINERIPPRRSINRLGRTKSLSMSEEARRALDKRG